VRWEQGAGQLAGEQGKDVGLPPLGILAVLGSAELEPGAIGESPRGAIQVDVGGFVAGDGDDVDIGVINP
jgi:hypothetical protein